MWHLVEGTHQTSQHHGAITPMLLNWLDEPTLMPGCKLVWCGGFAVICVGGSFLFYGQNAMIVPFWN
jgi:hypothetical protein